ncbi:hypothetical protein AB3S75_016952 [Citrus x aurantiifolia]
MAQWCCHMKLNGSTLGIKEATFAKAETLLHGHSFVQTIDSFQIIISKREATYLADRQANLGVRLQSWSQWMGVFHSRRDLNFTLSPTYHLSVGLVPSSTQRFIDRHLY